MLIINKDVELRESDAVTIALFTEIITWGYEAVVKQHKPVRNGDIYLSVNDLQIYNKITYILATNGATQIMFELGSPTLLTDIQDFMLEYFASHTLDRFWYNRWPATSRFYGLVHDVDGFKV